MDVKIKKVDLGLPEKVLFCKKCVISNQRPSSTIEFKNRPGDVKKTINFGTDQVCDACRFAEYKNTKIDWMARENELKKLCDKFRRNDGYWDCIVPSSGGKDSAFTAHKLKYKYGMNPLTVTWAPHEYTDIGRRNLQSFINSGFDNILVTPNGKVHKYLTKLAFLNLCHPFQPFILGQRFIGPKVAIEKNIPLIFYGENQAEYGNDIKENEDPRMSMNFFFSERDYDKIFLGGVSASELIMKHGLTKNDIEMYLPPAKDEILSKKVSVYYLGYYIKWDPQECFYYAAQNTGFQTNTERTEGTYSKYSSIDDKIDYIHYFTTLIKFGIGRATYDAAQEIRNGKISREEGVALVKKYDTEFPKKFFQDCLRYMDITEEQFWDTVNKFRSQHLWEEVDGKFILKQQVSNNI
ncbi:MAG: N-acetyl sugar amidotransferase [Candidatus Omnitrophica bacterium]|nr:N-acetyl sugar amidotransferase [Candidatus Omnitrophota bacterium]